MFINVRSAVYENVKIYVTGKNSSVIKKDSINQKQLIQQIYVTRNFYFIRYGKCVLRKGVSEAATGGLL